MSNDLTPEDRELLKALLDEGKFIPERFRGSLFAEAAATELVWPGKTTRVETAVLPFQSIEHIDEPRRETSAIPSLFDLDSGSGRQIGGWTNKLIWGDNRLILSSLANGPMRQQIEDAGGLKLVYIDPPFDVGANFSMNVKIGDESVTKEPSLIEEIAYRDTWGRGRDSFLSMLSERLNLIHSLMVPGASILVHMDWRMNSLSRLLLDDIFGSDQLRNEIVWCYYGPSSPGQRHFNRKHDTIWWFTKSGADYFFDREKARLPYHESTAGKWESEGTGFGGESPDFSIGKLAEDWWSDIPIAARRRTELTGYPTQKPEKLLTRIIESLTQPGDLVADFFCGSGTTAAVAERLGRKWIAADLGRFAIHTTRKRLISVQRELRTAGSPYRAFEVLNLGAYERQHFVGVDVNLSAEEQSEQAGQREEAYLSLILRAYSGVRAIGTPPFHGVKGRTAVFIGPIDSPVTENQVREAIAAAVSTGIARVDVLGFEFEMGLKPLLQDEAKDQGVNLALRYIPNDVFDRRAIQTGDVKFHDVAYVEFRTSMSGSKVVVELADFAVFYRQEDAEAAAAGLRDGSSRVVVDDGQVVKVSKDRQGIVTRDVLTSKWTDWIDYWAVDYDYMSQPEVVRVVENGQEKQLKTGRFVFENRWQSFRTKQNRELEFASAPFEYVGPGTYRVAVKVIDIFGNDTTRVVSVRARS